MTDVYVLAMGEYSDETPIAVYSTLEQAKGQLPVNAVWKARGPETFDGVPLPEQWWTILEEQPYHKSVWSIYQVPLDEMLSVDV